MSNNFINPKRWLILFVFIFSNLSVFAASVTSSASGNWSATAWPNTGRTGTITTSTSNNTVTGSGTSFTTEVSVGNIIKNTSNVVIGTVAKINSNTSITLTANAASSNTGIAFRTQGVGPVDAITIGAAHAITVDDTFTVASISFTAANTQNSITVSNSNMLTVTGLITMNTPTSNSRASTINVNAGTVICGSLTMSGSSSSRRSNINITTGLLDINGTLTSTSSSGSVFTITSTGTLKFGGTVDVDITLTPGSTSTVVYDGAAQTVRPITYANLTLAGSGSKTVTTVTVNGILGIQGTATLSTTITFGASSGIHFSNTTRTVASNQWPASFSNSQGVTVGDAAVITLNEAKSLGTDDSLKILTGGTLNTGNFGLTLSGVFYNEGTFNAGSSTITCNSKLDNTGTFNGNTSSITLNADMTNTGTFTGGTCNVTIAGTATQSIGSFSTGGTITLTKTSGQATFTGNVTGGPLTLNGTGGTLSLGTDLDHSFTKFTRGPGTLKGGSSIITFTDSAFTSTGTFTAETSTVRWMSNEAAQDISSVTYYNVEFGGSSVKTTYTFTTINNNFIMSGTASTTSSANLTVGGDFIIGDGNTYNAAAFSLTVSDSTIIGTGTGGTLNITSATGAKTFGNLIINANGDFVNSANAAITINGHLYNNGTFTTGTNTYTLAGAGKEISGTVSLSNLTISGVYTNIGTLTLGANPSGAGTLVNGDNGTINVNFTGALSFTNFTATNTGNTVNYTFAGAQTVHPSNYYHLNLGTSGVKTLQTGTTTVNGNLSISGSASATGVIGLLIGNDFSMSNTATFVPGAFTHTIVGNVNIASGTTVDFSSATLSLTGNSQSFVNSNGLSTFNGLTISNGEKTFNSNVKVNGVLTINSGAKFVYGSTTSLELAGTITGAGTIKAKACGSANNTLTLSGTSVVGSINLESGFEHLSNLIITKTAGSATFNSAIALATSMQFPSSGTFVATFNDNLNLYGASFTASNLPSKVTMSSSSSLSIGGCVTGTAAITIPSNAFSSAPTIRNLTVNSSNGLTLGNQMIKVTDVLTLTLGTLTTAGNLTLVSTSTKTARVGPVTGAISGNVTAERFIPGGSGKRKWRFLSAPVHVSNSIALSQYQDDIFVTAPAAAGGGFDVNPFTNNASIRTYTESTSGSLNNGWTNPTNITNTIPRGIGAEVFVRGSRSLANPYLNWTVPDDVTIDYIGSLNTGTISPTITYTNTGSGTNDGFNLVGNPYASPINFDTTGWTKTNIENKYWCYNPNTTLWGSYNATTDESINSMTKYISSGQAFFVRATSASPVITFTESIKTTSGGNNYYRSAQSSGGKFPVLRITLTNDSADTDETLIILDPQSTYKSEDGSDMLKFYNDALNVYTFSSDKSVMGMNAIPNTNSIDTLSLPVWSYDTSSIAKTHHILNFSRYESIDTSIHLYLIDNFLNTTFDIRTHAQHDFIITEDPATYGNERFKIVFNKNSAAQGIENKTQKVSMALYPNPADESLYIQYIGAYADDSEVEISIYDLMGNLLSEQQNQLVNSITKIAIDNLAKGTYLLRATNKGNTVVKKFIKR